VDAACISFTVLRQKYLRQLAHKEKRFILAHESTSFSPIALGLWEESTSQWECRVKHCLHHHWETEREDCPGPHNLSGDTPQWPKDFSQGPNSQRFQHLSAVSGCYWRPNLQHRVFGGHPPTKLQVSPVLKKPAGSEVQQNCFVCH
jgi:hypothetical protein